jgi:hypothetical protein
MSDKISVRISYTIPEDVSREEGALPPVSESLARFLQTNSAALEHPSVGLGGADRGEGQGNGVNNDVPFSFTFPRLNSITRATLTLDLKPKDPEVTTDGLQFTDNWETDPRVADKLYGNDILAVLAVDEEAIVNFDLTNINLKGDGNENLSDLLLDGSLDVLYRDDAIIYAVTLDIEGSAALPT